MNVDKLGNGVVAVVLLTCLCASAASVSGGQAADTGPTLVVEDASVGVGERTTVPVKVTSAPRGIAGYSLSVNLTGDSATIVGGSTNGDLKLATANVTNGGTTIRLGGVDLNDAIGNSSGEVQLGTITVRGESNGEASLEVNANGIDTDAGTEMQPATESGTVSVGSGAGSLQQTAITATLAVILFGVALLAGVGLLQVVR